jgi:hypothetical protein
MYSLNKMNEFISFKNQRATFWRLCVFITHKEHTCVCVYPFQCLIIRLPSLLLRPLEVADSSVRRVIFFSNTKIEIIFKKNNFKLW